MEEQWQQLKHLHHRLTTDREEGQTDQELRTMVTLATGILLSPAASCSADPSHCLHCHQLLLLTGIALQLSQSGKPHPGSQGDLETLTGVLLRCFDQASDPHILYAVKKCLVLGMCAHSFQVRCVVEAMLRGFGVCSHVDCHCTWRLELCRELLSSCAPPGVQTQTCAVLTPHLTLLVKGSLPHPSTPLLPHTLTPPMPHPSKSPLLHPSAPLQPHPSTPPLPNPSTSPMPHPSTPPLPHSSVSPLPQPSTPPQPHPSTPPWPNPSTTPMPHPSIPPLPHSSVSPLPQPSTASQPSPSTPPPPSSGSPPPQLTLACLGVLLKLVKLCSRTSDGRDGISDWNEHGEVLKENREDHMDVDCNEEQARKSAKFLPPDEADKRETLQPAQALDLYSLLYPYLENLSAILKSRDITADDGCRRLLCLKSLDIFNASFCYGDKLSWMQEIPEECVMLAWCLCDSGMFCESTLSALPLVPGQTSFGGRQGSVEHWEPDLQLLRKMSLLCFKLCAVLSRQHPPSLVMGVMTSLDSFVSGALLCSGQPDPLSWLVRVLGEQDDVYIEALLCLLDIHLHTHRSLRVQNSAMEELDTGQPARVPDPHGLFLSLLAWCQHSASLLVDWLCSPETCFLLYLTRYLKLLLREWDDFVSATHRRHCLSNTGCSGSCSGLADSRSASDQHAHLAESECGNMGVDEECRDLRTGTLVPGSCRKLEAQTELELCEEPAGVSDASGDATPHPSILNIRSSVHHGRDTTSAGLAPGTSAKLRSESGMEMSTQHPSPGRPRPSSAACKTLVAYSSSSDSEGEEDSGEECAGAAGTLPSARLRVSDMAHGTTLPVSKADPAKERKSHMEPLTESEKFCKTEDSANGISCMAALTDISDVGSGTENRTLVGFPRQPWRCRVGGVGEKVFDWRCQVGGAGDEVCDWQCLQLPRETLAEVCGCVERLARQNLFPYQPRPLLRLLRQCEECFDRTMSSQCQLCV